VSRGSEARRQNRYYLMIINAIESDCATSAEEERECSSAPVTNRSGVVSRGAAIRVRLRAGDSRARVRGVLHPRSSVLGRPVDLQFDHRRNAHNGRLWGERETCPAAPASSRPAGDRKHCVRAAALVSSPKEKGNPNREFCCGRQKADLTAPTSDLRFPPRRADWQVRTCRHVRFVPILLQKVFLGGEPKIL